MILVLNLSIKKSSTLVTKKEFSAVINRIIVSFLKGSNAVEVVATARALPADIAKSANDQGFDVATVAGDLHKDKAYLNRENIHSSKHTEQVIYHEHDY